MGKDFIPSSLLGRNVTIYRGGPESKNGILLDIQDDYVALQSEKDVIYYQSRHIQSISENSKHNARLQSKLESEMDCRHAQDFLALLESMANHAIQINQGGPESRLGLLLAVGEDYLVLWTKEDGAVYYNLQHIKSVVERKIPKHLENQKPDFILAPRFDSLFKIFNHQWVSINRGGPEALEGILTENSSGLYTLVHHEELFRIHPFHVKSISIGAKGADKQDKNKDGKQQSGKNEKDGRKSGDNSGNESSSSSSSYYEDTESFDYGEGESFSTGDSRMTPYERRTSGSSYRPPVRETVTQSRNYVWKRK
ncbi:hypothetical protein [Heyndrickxia acidiproducens]|uniref:hypothetical protein n=1 Tax=Heyndrickxia acidiproducens TaxID=1121084 RepID=UPI00036ED23F|nr:hypothetical protein [Heyndrickxia acidiproducens]